MKIRVMPGNSPLYIQLRVFGRDDMMLRRWPWPASPAQRQRHLDEAIDYGQKLAKVLNCPLEVCSSLKVDYEIGSGRRWRHRLRAPQLAAGTPKQDSTAAS
jgi:hypothetical protein